MALRLTGHGEMSGATGLGLQGSRVPGLLAARGQGVGALLNARAVGINAITPPRAQRMPAGQNSSLPMLLAATRAVRHQSPN